MPQRKFANQKALIDYAEQNGLVYVWAWIERQRVISPAFTKRKRLLSPDQYEIVDVHTSRGVRTAMLFPKAILQAEFAANARYARSWRSNESDGGRSGRRSKSDSYHEKRGGPLAGWKPARRETQVLNVLPKSLDPDVSNDNSLAHAQQPVSTHRPKLFFGQLS